MAIKPVKFGAYLLPRKDLSREQRVEENREMLARALNLRTTVAVVGTGFSSPLGYPRWEEMAEQVVAFALDELSKENGQSDDLARCKQFVQRLQGGGTQAEDLMYMTGACKEICARLGKASSLETWLAGRFSPDRARPVDGANPYPLLLELPIWRFMTTNYDVELEYALCEARGLAPEQYDIASERSGCKVRSGPTAQLRVDCNSFTHESRHLSQLTRFGIAPSEDYQDVVFHCHGRFDVPASMVFTERDYQQAYLARRSRSAEAFRDAIELLFSSNPILFLGFSLRDEDLLRQLRLLSAQDEEDKHRRPIFALMEDTADHQYHDRHAYLFERYGVHVIPYEMPENERDPIAWGRVHCRELKSLRERRDDWRDKWHQKPPLRRVVVAEHPPTTYQHYGFDEKGHERFGYGTTVEKNLDEIREKMQRPGVVGVMGPGGTGKSWHVRQLLERVSAPSDGLKGVFFWSSYYADDCLTGIERLNAYADPHGGPDRPRFERLRECLRSRYLVIFDGFERLLRPPPRHVKADAPDPAAQMVGRHHDVMTSQLLSLFRQDGCESTMIFTSRMWPEGLEGDRVQRIKLHRLHTDDLKGWAPFDELRKLDERSVSELCALLDGHAYAIALAGRLLKRNPRGGILAKFTELKRGLARTYPDRRLNRMIKESIDAIEGEFGMLVRPFLERMAVFMSPVGDSTLDACYEIATSVAPNGKRCGRDELLDALIDARLVFRVQEAGETTFAYTGHPTVRSWVFSQMHRAEGEVMPNFTLAGVTSGTVPVHPGSKKSGELVCRLFDDLERRARTAREAGDLRGAAAFCRAMFGLVRSRMEANTAARWTTYYRYLELPVRLLDLVREVSFETGSWQFIERHERSSVEHENAPLYGDELAFLYNDIGLALCEQGFMPGCAAVWSEGFEINRVIEGSVSAPQYLLQSQLHLAHTFIEIGRLRIAEDYLDETEQTNLSVRSSDYRARILGYRGLILHLRGHLSDADDCYGAALEILRQSGGNMRAESVFLRHRAALAMARGNFREATRWVQDCRAAADGGRFPELIGAARVTTGQLHREMGRLNEAAAEYQAALEDAHRIGIHRLEIEAQSELSRLALANGDYETARHRAMRALALANRDSLGLRVTHALAILGKAMIEGKSRELGVAYLNHAYDIGTLQEYWLRTQKVEAELRQLGEWTDRDFIA